MFDPEEPTEEPVEDYYEPFLHSDTEVQELFGDEDAWEG